MNNTPETDASLKKSSHIFFIYLFTLIYVLITALSITQVQLLLNDKVNLPIIGVGVNITFFTIVSPFILVTLFIIYNLHYLHLKKSASHYIKLFYYWPIFEFGKFDLEKGKNNWLNFLQSITASFIIWGLLPLTLFVICFIYLPSHELVTTIWLIVCSSLGNFLVYYFWIENNNYRKKLVNYSILICFILLVIFYFTVTPQYNSFVENFVYHGSGKDAKLLAIAIIITLLISIITVFVIRFFNKHWQFITTGKFFEHMFYNIWIIILLSPLICIHYLINTESGKNRNINLSYQIISQNPNQTHKGIYSVDLRSKNLINAKLISSVLIKADMRGANLRMAALYSARLDSANLQGATLEGANLLGAKLRYADLRGAHLGGTILKEADFSYADLRYAKLFSDSKLESKSTLLDSTILYKANLDSADLRGTNLTLTLILDSVKLHGATLDSADLHGVNLDSIDLSGANLKYAILNSASLRGANLKSANLTNAKLRDADLREANLQFTVLDSSDLRGAKVDYTQLENVKSLYAAKLDSSVLEDIRNHFDYLLEKR